MDKNQTIKQQFAHVYNEYKSRFVTIARRYVRDSMVAEDLVADSFTAFWRKIDSIPENANYPAYVLTIVKHNCLNYLEAQQIHLRVEEHLNSTRKRMAEQNIRSLNALDPDKLFAREVQAIVSEAIAKMPELTRIVFTKSRKDGLTYAEIAKECGISTRQVTTEIQKALSILRKSLSDYLPAWLVALYLNNLL